MPAPDKPQYDDRLVIQYLLGALPEADVSRLDELSIADDEFAARLAAVEDDLVDAYVRGELAGPDRERFQSHYLLSPAAREKVRFAEALTITADRSPAVLRPPEATGRWHWRPIWQFTAAACLLLLAGGYLLYQNGRLRNQISQVVRDRDALQARQRLLEQQEVAVQPAPPPRPSFVAPAIVLLPQTRGIGPPAAVALSPDTDRVELLLQLEEESFPAYRIRMKDAATNGIVWQSDTIPSVARGLIRGLPVSLPAAILKPRNYSLELTGVPAKGAAVSLSGYSLRVVR